MKGIRLLRIAVVLILVGLMLELVAVVSLTPVTFMLFAVVGIPCLLLGVVLYLIKVIAVMKRKEVL